MFDKLVDLLVSSLRLFQFFSVVFDYEGGVVLRLGRFHRLAGPGFHWLWPFKIEELVFTSVVPETTMVGPQSLTTKDEQSIVITTVVTHKVNDTRKFLLEIEGGSQVITDASYGFVAHLVMAKTWQELVDMDLDEELTKVVRKRAWRYGVEVMSVQVADFTRSRSYRLMQSQPNHFAAITAV